MANINFESRVLLCDKTKGLLAGALIEKSVSEVLHVEFSGHQLKLQNEILLEYNYEYTKEKIVSYIHQSCLDKDNVKEDVLLN